MNKQFLKSQSYLHRLTYLEFGRAALTVLSRDFLKQHIMSNCLKLYTDKTVSIRIRLAQMLPELRDKMKDKDKANIGLVELILEKFSSDKVIRVQE